MPISGVIWVKCLSKLFGARARIQIPFSYTRACVLITHWMIFLALPFLGSLWFAQKTWLHYIM